MIQELWKDFWIDFDKVSMVFVSPVMKNFNIVIDGIQFHIREDHVEEFMTHWKAYLEMKREENDERY